MPAWKVNHRVGPGAARFPDHLLAYRFSLPCLSRYCLLQKV